MNAKQVKNAIMDLLVREIPTEKDTIEELGGKIEVILDFFPLKKRKDRYAPKKVLTAYNFFCQKNRTETIERMEQEGGEKVKSVDVVRGLARKWKELKQGCNDGDVYALEEMDEYKALSNEDMERFLEQDRAYRGV